MSRHFITNSMLVSIMLFPWIPLTSNLPMLRPEWIIVIFGVLIFKISNLSINSKITYFSVFVSLCYIFSILNASINLDRIIDTRDYTVLLQPILYCIIYQFCSSNVYTEIEYKNTLILLQYIFFISSIIAIIQFFNPAPIEPILHLFTDKERTDTYILQRATGTMGNPNDLGFLMVIGFCLSLFTFKYYLKSIYFSILILLVTFLGILSSGSRTSMICMVSVTILFLILELKFKIINLIIISFIGSFIFWLYNAFLVYFESAQGFVERITSLQNIQDDTAWNPRVEGVLSTIPLILESLFLGYGPDKATFTVGSNIDNEYILMLYRFGVLGTLFTIIFIILIAKQRYDDSVKEIPLMKSMKTFSVTILLSGSIYAYTAGLFSSFRLFGLLIIIWTISSRVVSDSKVKLI
jgi:O-antigen ligase